MRAFPWIVVFVSMGWLGCGLDSEGQAVDFPPGTAEAGPGGAAGSGGTSESGGSGGEAGSAAAGGTGATGGTAGTGGTGATGGTAGTGGTGATGGTAGTGGTGAGGTAGAAGAGGTTDPEDCTNGIDDNGDGLADCADPQCQPDFTCAPEPPSGWSTIGFVAERDATTPAVDCGSLEASALTLRSQLQGPDTGCSCECAAPVDGVCSVSTVLWENPNCSGGASSLESGCYDFYDHWRIGGVETGDATVSSPGACEASAGGTPDAAGFNQAADLCLAPVLGGGCGDGQVCVPRPQAPLELEVCVEQAGQVACPAAFPNQRIYHETFVDERTCSVGGCSCDPASGQSCEVQVALYDNDQCSGTPKGLYPVDGTCHATGFGYGDLDSARFVGSILGGSCPAAGTASVDGSVEPTGPHTLCCVVP